MDREEIIALLALLLCEGIGAKRAVDLRDFFGSCSRVLEVSANQLERVPGIGASTAAQIAQSRAEAKATAERVIAQLDSDTQIVTIYDDVYPEELRSIYSPPPLLFVRGNPALLSAPKRLAVIGSRRTTDYGRACAKSFCEDFAREDAVIVSGFAKGIDTVAQQAAFQAGGKTIAVLGSGVDVIYPATNKAFATELVESGRGLIVSELLPGAPPDARNFPWRNRIVSGLSQGILVVESDLTGGSMITASLALDQNREIFAIPGDINRPMSGGPNSLIRDSRAKLASSAQHVMEDLGWIGPRRPKKPDQRGVNRSGLDMFENQLIDVFEEAGVPLHIDALSERSGREVQDLLVSLLTLEFKGLVRQMAGKQFTLVS